MVVKQALKIFELVAKSDQQGPLLKNQAIHRLADYGLERKDKNCQKLCLLLTLCEQKLLHY